MMGRLDLTNRLRFEMCHLPGFGLTKAWHHDFVVCNLVSILSLIAVSSVTGACYVRSTLQKQARVHNLVLREERREFGSFYTWPRQGLFSCPPVFYRWRHFKHFPHPPSALLVPDLSGIDTFRFVPHPRLPNLWAIEGRSVTVTGSSCCLTVVCCPPIDVSRLDV
jgi:hypothetical protein